MSQELDRIADSYLETVVEDNPVTATFLGIHHLDGEFGDYSPDALDGKHQRLKSLLTRLEALSLDGAAVNTKIDAAVLRAALTSDIFWFEELRYYETQPAFPLRIALSGCNTLIIRDFAPLEERAESLLSRIRRIPDLLASGRQCIKDPPSIFVTVAVEAAKGGPLFLSRTVPQIGDMVPALKDDLAAASEKASRAFGVYAADIAKLEGASDRSFAIGREKYEWMLRNVHLLDSDSDSLLAMGKEVYHLTRARIDELAREIDPGKDWAETLEGLKSEHPTAEGLRDRYAIEMRRARDFVREKGLVTIPPGEKLDVIDTPEFLRSTLPYAAYMPPGPFEKIQQGFLYVTPVDTSLTEDEQELQLKGHSVHTIPIVALHEGYPGHHLQLVRANAVPSRARRLVWNNVFIEGWALYCEEMMKEEGFYSDPLTRLGQLKENLWRAARVVVDVMLQLGTMSYEEAIEHMIREVRLERIDATAEVKRYTGNPTQPSSYMIGKLAIQKIRKDYQAKHGLGFNLRTFHDALLDAGSIQPRLAEAALGLTDDV